MRINILVTKLNKTEILLKFNANNKLINETEQFCKGMDVSQVISKITNSIVSDKREFRKFEVIGVYA